MVSLVSDKPNMTTRGGTSPWRYLESVSLHNATAEYEADSVGVATPWVPAEKDAIKAQVEAD